MPWTRYRRLSGPWFQALHPSINEFLQATDSQGTELWVRRVIPFNQATQAYQNIADWDVCFKRNKLPLSLLMSNVRCSLNSCGGGGFADIYKGTTHDGQTVALNRLRVFQMTPTFRKGFHDQGVDSDDLSTVLHRFILVVGITRLSVTSVHYMAKLLPQAHFTDSRTINFFKARRAWVEHGNIRNVVDDLKARDNPGRDDLQSHVHQWAGHP